LQYVAKEFVAQGLSAGQLCIVSDEGARRFIGKCVCLISKCNATRGFGATSMVQVMLS